MGISLSSLYYRPKLPAKDWHLKIQIEEVLHDYPSYGHRRVALVLGMNKKRVLRVMRLFGIKPYRRRPKRPASKRNSQDPSSSYPNLLLIIFPLAPGRIWVSDFTPIPYRGKFIYLATVMDVFSREIVGFSLLNAHTVWLVIGALFDALGKHQRPQILHSDQGAEYTAKAYLELVTLLRIKISMNRKASPWENGYQESFYSQFKVDLGDPNRFASLGELVFAIYFAIHTYNYSRIHTKLKMPPARYREHLAAAA